MKTTFSLQSIITEILIEKGSEDTPEKIRKVRRSFDALLARLGSDKAILKIQNKESSDGKKSRDHEVMLFDEFEKPMIKTLLLQLMDKKSLIYKFAHPKHYKAGFSSSEVFEFIETLKAEIFKDPNLVDIDMVYLHDYLVSIFLYSPLRSKETCHKLIDAIAATLYDLPCYEQTMCLDNVVYFLRKEYWLRTAEAAIGSLKVAENIKDENELSIVSDPDIRAIYVKRDSEIMKAIQNDDDLRQYIEKKAGRQAELIFEHAILE